MIDPLQPNPILQTTLPEAPWDSVATGRLPGTGPIKPGDWLRIDTAYAAQMALRDRLIAARLDAVHALLPRALEPAQELLSAVIKDLVGRAGFTCGKDKITRPDGKIIAVDFNAPLITLGQLMPQDFCILQRGDHEHILTGAILCFPASWTLHEKIGHPLTAIHDPVTDYTNNIATRVQRLFDGVRVNTPLWRVNLLRYHDATLHQPRRVGEKRKTNQATAPFIRSERQCISRLPNSDAIVFAIHTVVVCAAELPDERRRKLANYRPETV